MTPEAMAQAIADLDALEADDGTRIDSPELRILAACDYLVEWQQNAHDAVDEYQATLRRDIRGLFLATDFMDLAESNAFRRGEKPTCMSIDAVLIREGGAGWDRLRALGLDPTPCTCIPALWACPRTKGPQLIAADFLTARSTVLGRYKGKTRERAAEILEDWMPLYLRKGANRVDAL